MRKKLRNALGSLRRHRGRHSKVLSHVSSLRSNLDRHSGVLSQVSSLRSNLDRHSKVLSQALGLRSSLDRRSKVLSPVSARAYAWAKEARAAPILCAAEAPGAVVFNPEEVARSFTAQWGAL